MVEQRFWNAAREIYSDGDVVFVGLSGSHYFGTNNENSDVDLIVVINRWPREEVFRHRHNRRYKTEIDGTVYDFQALTHCEFLEKLALGSALHVLSLFDTDGWYRQLLPFAITKKFLRNSLSFANALLADKKRSESGRMVIDKICELLVVDSGTTEELYKEIAETKLYPESNYVFFESLVFGKE